MRDRSAAPELFVAMSLGQVVLAPLSGSADRLSREGFVQQPPSNPVARDLTADARARVGMRKWQGVPFDAFTETAVVTFDGAAALVM